MSAIKTVFSDLKYLVLSGVIFVLLFVPLSIISEYLFTEPYFVFYVAPDRILGFILIIVVSIMSGLVLSMNVYRIKKLQNSAKKIGGGLFGSVIGASAGACSCSSIGFAIVSTFGAAGGIATSFLTNYEIPLRLAAISILVYTYFATTKALSYECRIRN